MADTPRLRCRLCQREIPDDALDLAFRIEPGDIEAWLCPECRLLIEPLIRGERTGAPRRD